MSKELIVGDYMFPDLETANIAKSEQEKIDKLNEKLVGADMDILYKVYNKSIEKNTFKTPVGLSYMKSLKTALEKGGKDKDSILPIPVNALTFDNPDKKEKNDNITKYKNEAQKNKSFFRWSLFINAVLVVMVVLLFIISWTSNTPNILNYENALVDKYASWEMELKEKEKELNEREKIITSMELKTPGATENE